MIGETYVALRSWDSLLSAGENWVRIEKANVFGSRSQSWTKKVARELARRFEPEGREAALCLAAKAEVAPDVWKPLLLWHTAASDFLVYRFVTEWLWQARRDGRMSLLSRDLDGFFASWPNPDGTAGVSWRSETRRRVASGLLKLATDFGIIEGAIKKTFAPYRMPDEAFLYVLYAMYQREKNPARVMGAPAWRLFQLDAPDVERELLRLHQYRKVQYEVAGTLAQLTLPFVSPSDFVRSLTA